MRVDWRKKPRRPCGNCGNHYAAGHFRTPDAAICRPCDAKLARARGEKWCPPCGAHLPVAEFNIHNGKPDGLQTYCKPHQYKAAFPAQSRRAKLPHVKAQKSVRDRAAYQADPEKFWAYNLRAKYGVGPEWYADRMERQGHRCACCGIHQSEALRRFAVDHCHKGGQLRGLLCSDCNLGIGQLGDDVEGVLRALSYLWRWRRAAGLDPA